MDAQSGALIVHRALRTRTDRGSVFRTNLHRFHASFGFGPGFEHAVVDYRRRGGRFFIDNGAFLGGRISHHIIFRGNGGLRKGRSDRKRDDGA